jgi:hypothetical protein
MWQNCIAAILCQRSGYGRSKDGGSLEPKIFNKGE